MKHEARWSFAVIADTHVEADPGAAANLRLAAVVGALERHRPDFVLHLGDIVHPLAQSPLAAEARRNGAELLGRLSCPVHLLPGNHDIGDKPLEGMPAAPVRAEWRQDWIGRHGADFTWFDHAGWRLVLVNSPVLNSDAAVAGELASLLDRIAALPDAKPLILATHYPLFLADPDEEGHYDNIGNPARARLLDFCRTAPVSAVFTGHVHTYLGRRLGMTRFHGTPSTAFLRRDFSEAARIAPRAEHGREDPDKTGFFWVDVAGEDLSVRMVSTSDLDRFAQDGWLPGDARKRARLPIGVNLRHDWARVIDLPFNPPVAPFTRRRFRDDDGLRALIETGIRDLRIPAADLLDRDNILRLEEMQAMGFRFCTFAPGPPPAAVLAALDRHAAAIDAVELIAAPEALAARLAPVAALCRQHGLSLWHGPLGRPDEADSRATHRIGYGFSGPDAAGLSAAMAALKRAAAKAGLVFSIPMAGFSPRLADRLAHLAEANDIDAVVLLDRLADDTVALADDKVLPLRVAEALAIARARPRLRLFLDSFVDMDRGYHARCGLVDRRMTPTAAGRVLREAHSVRRGLPAR